MGLVNDTALYLYPLIIFGENETWDRETFCNKSINFLPQTQEQIGQFTVLKFSNMR